VAFVTLRAGARVEESEIKALVAARLSRMYVPDQVRFVSALPENAVGKLDRNALRKLLA